MRTLRVKICGITSLEDALAAVDAGADALGFVFAPSPRRVTPEAAAAIIAGLPPFVTTVGLVVDQDPAPILDRCPIDVIQFHGAETPQQIARCSRRAIKAIRVSEAADIQRAAVYRGTAAALLLDAHVPGIAGGTGKSFDWSLITHAQELCTPLIIAGGLTPENVADCVRRFEPYGVDVSSGVEAHPGRKDHEAMRRFVAAVRAAGAS